MTPKLVFLKGMNRKNSKLNITAVDLFCGAGGLTRGLLDSGIKVKIGVDFDGQFKDTYEKNNHPSRFLQCDIRKLKTKYLEECLKLEETDLFLLSACAPCQPFSRQNSKHHYDRRKSLLLEVVRILDELKRKPDFLFFENVPHINRSERSTVLRRLRKALVKMGYSFDSKIVDAAIYGVPQRRKRFILIAVKKKIAGNTVRFPEELFGKDRNQPYRTVREAIGAFPRIRAGQTHAQVANHQTQSLTTKTRMRLLLTPKNGGSRRDWPDRVKLKCHEEHVGHWDVYGRMKWNEPSPTLTCRCTSISNGRFGHPTQLRAISLREAAALQTFPNDYQFYGSFKAIAMQVGNAVPVLLAEAFGKHFIEIGNGKSFATRTEKNTE